MLGSVFRLFGGSPKKLLRRGAKGLSGLAAERLKLPLVVVEEDLSKSRAKKCVASSFAGFRLRVPPWARDQPRHRQPLQDLMNTNVSSFSNHLPTLFGSPSSPSRTFQAAVTAQVRGLHGFAGLTLDSLGNPGGDLL